jgi:plastocyanin
MIEVMKKSRVVKTSLILLFCLALLLPLGFVSASKEKVHKITIPEEDRFVPFALTIRAGETVQWVNNDSDDHTVVSNDTFTTTNHKGVNVVIPGTDNNGGKPGVYELRFTEPGQFVYYCRFHSKLDGEHQPVAPGPDGGIQDDHGNFGTPMNGIITVLPDGN